MVRVTSAVFQDVRQFYERQTSLDPIDYWCTTAKLQIDSFDAATVHMLEKRGRSYAGAFCKLKY